MADEPRRRFRFGIADSVKQVRGIVGGILDEAREGVKEARTGLRKRRLL